MKKPDIYQPPENEKVEREKPLCQFEFTEMTSKEVPPEVKDGIQQAMTILWQDEVNQPATFKITLCDRAVHTDTQEPTKLCSSYNIESDEFMFAIESTREIMAPALKLPLNITLILMAGHEAVHKAQLFRGDTPTTTFDNNLDFKEEYWHFRHEIEAWEKAMTVFKKIFPNAYGSIKIAGREYKLPE